MSPTSYHCSTPRSRRRMLRLLRFPLRGKSSLLRFSSSSLQNRRFALDFVGTLFLRQMLRFLRFLLLRKSSLLRFSSSSLQNRRFALDFVGTLFLRQMLRLLRFLLLLFFLFPIHFIFTVHKILLLIFQRRMVGTRGLEPRTSSLSEKRSNQLSYAPDLWTKLNSQTILEKKCLVSKFFTTQSD